jgi:hypothetical protein
MTKHEKHPKGNDLAAEAKSRKIKKETRKFARLFRQLLIAFNSKSREFQGRVLEEIEAMPASHPIMEKFWPLRLKARSTKSEK